jgi:predicted exporter
MNNSFIHKTLSYIWLFILTLLTVTALLAMTFNIWPGLPVKNNIMSLLPNLRNDPVLLQALEHSNNAMSQKLVILVGDTDKHRTDVAATTIIDSMTRQDFFAQPMTGVNAEQAREIGRFYYNWRQVLVSDAQRRLIARADWTDLQNQLQQSLYSPISGINATILENDPLLTFYHFMRALPIVEGKIQSDNGNLIVHDTDRDYRVIMVDIKHDVFDMDFHPHYQTWRNQIEKTLHEQSPDTRLLLAGAVEHAVWGASSAKHEVNVIGNGSLIGIIVLILLVFPGARALLAALLPLGAGVIAGLIITIWCFGEIHLITLVFGSSVIGVAMDYSLHYLSEHYKSSTHDGAKICMRRIFPGISFAMITSAIAYAAIGFAPFPVLRQIAVFSCAGLFMAWFTVVSLYPSIVPAANYKNPWYLRVSGDLDQRLRHLFDKTGSKIFLVILAIAMLPGVLGVHANDDMRLLQTPKASIIATEQKIQSLTGLQASGRFFLIEGETEEQVLQRCEELNNWLQETKQKASIDLLSNYIPSQKMQAQNFSLLQSLYLSGTHFAQQWQFAIGIPDNVIAKSASLFKEQPAHYLTPEFLLDSGKADSLLTNPLQKSLERFQLTQTGRGYIVSARIINAEDSHPLREYAEQHPGIHWMDPVSDISALFQHYREQTGWMMLVAYGLIALLLCWRYQPAAALRVLIAPALAAWLALGILGYAGVAINLFHILALLLVLGVGIDYSIFFAESDEHRDTTMLAVILSTITTLLSFGLLALSQTAAISSFGIVVSIGIICSLLLSPLAQYHPQQNPQYKGNV